MAFLGRTHSYLLLTLLPASVFLLFIYFIYFSTVAIIKCTKKTQRKKCGKLCSCPQEGIGFHRRCAIFFRHTRLFLTEKNYLLKFSKILKIFIKFFLVNIEPNISRTSVELKVFITLMILIKIVALKIFIQICMIYKK